jgi:hypothetical protein
MVAPCLKTGPGEFKGATLISVPLYGIERAADISIQLEKIRTE